MSKSKEGMDKNLADGTPRTEETINQPTTDEIDRKLGARGQTDYTSGRESLRDFPRRSTSQRYRSETLRQTTNNPERANLYRQPNQTEYRQPDRYENRGGQREDTGDFYSRSIRERVQDSDFDRPRRRGKGLEHNRQYEDPNRTYERGGQSSGHQQANQQQYGQRFTTRDFGTPNNRAQEYGPQDTRSQESYDSQNYDTRRYGSQSYNPRNANPEPAYRNEPNQLQEEVGYRNEHENTDYDRNARFGTGYEYMNAPYGFDIPYYDANAVRYDSQGWPYSANEHYRYTLRCRDLMTKDVTACAPESSIREVAEKMEDENVGSIPVIENGRLIGIVTDRDIVCRVLAEGKNTRATTAREAMTDDIVTCTPDESILEVIRKMSEHQIRRIPICDPNGKLRGMISIGDIALEAERDRDLACALERISQPTPYQAHRR